MSAHTGSIFRLLVLRTGAVVPRAGSRRPASIKMQQELGTPLLPAAPCRGRLTDILDWRRLLAIPAVLVISMATTAVSLHAALIFRSAVLSPGRTMASSSVSAPQPRRVLLTGYGAWGTLSVNPAQQVVTALNGSCINGVCFEGWVLPVSTEGASRAASALMARSVSRVAPWDAVVHIGLEASSKGLRIETAAANVKATEHSASTWSADVPCNKSGSSWSSIDDTAPCLLASTAPLDELTLDSATDDSSPIELWSRDAGVFYCNEALYRTLAVVRAQRIRPASAWRSTAALLPATFIHLPTVKTSPLSTSITFVSHVGGRMAGKELPSPSLSALLVATAGSSASD